MRELRGQFCKLLSLASHFLDEYVLVEGRFNLKGSLRGTFDQFLFVHRRKQPSLGQIYRQFASPGKCVEEYRPETGVFHHVAIRAQIFCDRIEFLDSMGSRKGRLLGHGEMLDQKEHK